MNVLLGITGGIAAYKAPELVRRLGERGHCVRVVATRGALAFVTPLTLQAVSGQPVHRDLLDESAEAAMGHIELARWAELVLVAPATAHFLARLAHGLADDLLTTLCLATTAPIWVAPAMNRQMWAAAATRENVSVLERRGVRVLGPASGAQACGETGPGRMVEPEELAALVPEGGAGAPSGPGVPAPEGAQEPLQGLRVLITAGPTREAIDPVRYISNHSSGRMGFALAEAARELGAEVTLVAGPTALEPPPGVRVRRVVSAREMYDAVMAELEGCDVFIGAAAVADYTPATRAPQKIKKGAEVMELELVRTPDILAAVAAAPRRPFTVGFAAETERLEEHAREKLLGKKVDMIAANRVDDPTIGFDAEDNALVVLWPEGEERLERAPKHRIARALLTLVAERCREARRAART